jgi:hypothetical protein
LSQHPLLLLLLLLLLFKESKESFLAGSLLFQIADVVAFFNVVVDF